MPNPASSPKEYTTPIYYHLFLAGLIAFWRDEGQNELHVLMLSDPHHRPLFRLQGKEVAAAARRIDLALLNRNTGAKKEPDLITLKGRNPNTEEQLRDEVPANIEDAASTHFFARINRVRNSHPTAHPATGSSFDDKLRQLISSGGATRLPWVTHLVLHHGELETAHLATYPQAFDPHEQPPAPALQFTPHGSGHSPSGYSHCLADIALLRVQCDHQYDLAMKLSPLGVGKGANGSEMQYTWVVDTTPPNLQPVVLEASNLYVGEGGGRTAAHFAHFHALVDSIENQNQMRGGHHGGQHNGGGIPFVPETGSFSFIQPEAAGYWRFASSAPSLAPPATSQLSAGIQRPWNQALCPFVALGDHFVEST